MIRLILLVGLLAATTGCALGDKLKAEARAEREIFYYKGHERVPLTFSSDLYMATVRPRPGPTDRKAVVQTMENAGALNVRLRGEQLYFKAPERAVADRALQALTTAGIDYTSLSAAILGQRQPVFIGDQVVVKLRHDKDLAAFRAYIKGRGAAEVGHYRFGGHDRMVLRAAKRTSVIGLANRIQENGWSIFAQPDFIAQGTFNYTPNDIIFAKQEQAFRIFRIPEAWDITKGNPDVAVAIFDTGYRLTHPDLADYSLRSRICGPFNILEADCPKPFALDIAPLFGPTNIVAPLDAVDDDDNPEMESDLDFHGTFVLGTIAAKTDNANGVAGVGFNNKVVPVKVGVTIECFLGGGLCAEFSCSAITRAANHVINAAGIDVVAVNMSFVIGGDELCFEDALSDIHINARHGKGAVMIAGTGNDGREVGRRVLPAGFPFVIGTGESDGESRGFQSNFGPLVDIMARGTTTTARRGQIGLNNVQSDYSLFLGTSASAAMVSGIVGLIASVQPARNAFELERILLHSTDLMIEDLQYTWVDDHVLGMKNLEVGFGRVNAFKAVRMASRLHIPRSIHPMLYVSRIKGDNSIYVLDKEPDRNYPNFSELVMTTLEIQGEPLEGEYLAVQLRTVPLRGEGVNLLYRVGNQAELIQVLDPISGFGSVLYRRSLSDGPLPGTSIAYVANRRVVREQTNSIPLLRAQFLVTYYPKDGMQRTYRLTDGFLGQLNLTQVHEEQLNPNGGYSYGFLKEGFQARLVRFSPADRRLDFVAIDDSGTPSGPTTSTTFTPEDQPELWTVYSGKDKNFLYWQADPFSYQIAETTLDGVIVTKEKHNSSFSDTPFDRMAVHHVYDQDKPYFIFWKNNGIVKVKRLISELELDIFTVNTKSFRAQGDPGNIWISSEMLTY